MKVIWFTGLPCSGKTTLAEALVEILRAEGKKVEFLDGDRVRQQFPQTGFSAEARNEHIRRIGFLASRLESHGVWVVASFVSPYRESREAVRALCKNFVEVYISTPLEDCERRDVKGMYAKARRGEITNFTGVSDPYEPPTKAELVLDTSRQSLPDCLALLKAVL